MLQIEKNISLKKYNSFGVQAYADAFAKIETIDDAKELVSKISGPPLKKLILGGGCNMLFVSDYNGLIIHSKMMGIKVIDQSDDYAVVEAGSGVEWNDFVEFCVERDLYGLENLAAIPGTVGAAPVQNIGAYGAEQKDCFLSLKALDLISGDIVELNYSDCRFEYRMSAFKNIFADKYLILSVCYKLSKTKKLNLNYKDIRQYLETNNIKAEDCRSIYKAICSIRYSKLPDYKSIGNAGSFFMNPVITAAEMDRILSVDSDAPHFNDSGNYKIPAAYLIEKRGWKGYREGDAGVYDKHALILINYGNASGRQIFDLSEKIIDSVRAKYGITLKREAIIV
jgi:UDP-N-acetylmuramate dehydrogenase